MGFFLKLSGQSCGVIDPDPFFLFLFRSLSPRPAYGAITNLAFSLDARLINPRPAYGAITNLAFSLDTRLINLVDC
jgi:hypothetical protein